MKRRNLMSLDNDQTHPNDNDGDAFEFYPIPENDPESEDGIPFALITDGENQILKTPFGVFKIAADATGPLGELAAHIKKLFTEGVNSEGLEHLARLIAALPEVQQALEQVPQLKELLEQARVMLAAAGLEAGGSMSGGKPRFNPPKLAFDRVRNTVCLN
jgi:hypothetical protein